MMQDPIIKAVMRRDAVKETELRTLIDRMRATYAFDVERLPRGRLN
jgi:hypothetical protein